MSTAMRSTTDQAPEVRGEWEDYRDALLQDPEARAEYARTYRDTLFLRRLLQQVEAARIAAGLSKAELARRVGVNPSAMRRLLTAETSNPTLKTMLGLVDALGLEVTLQSSRPGPGEGQATAAATSRERDTALAS